MVADVGLPAADQARESTASVASPPLKIALCLAGAWRDKQWSWPRINTSIVHPLGDVDIYAVSDEYNRGPHGVADAAFTVDKMRSFFGPQFKAGEYVRQRVFSNLTGHTWPEVADAKKDIQENQFRYAYTIWRCGQLIAQSGVAYDAIIRSRPDIHPVEKWHMARTPDGQIELQVGGRCVTMGERDVVVPAFSAWCGQDWMAVGRPAAMTVTMDILRFWTPASGYLAPDAAFNTRLTQGLEQAYNWLWWRTGTRVLRRPLYVDMGRRHCRTAHCIRMPAWSILPHLRPPANESFCHVLPRLDPLPPVGALVEAKGGWANDCGAVDGERGDLDYFSRGYVPSDNATNDGPPRQVSSSLIKYKNHPVEPGLVARPAYPPTWTRPICGDVPDLAVRNALIPCRKATGDEASRKPSGHRPTVLRGYGVPLIFGESSVRI